MIHLTIDDLPIEMPEGRSLLEACREHGIYIPTLCYHPALEPYGGCRLCMVEVSQGSRKPRLAAACVYPCEEGLAVKTNTEAVQRSRRMTAELLMAGAGDVPEIQELAASLGVTSVRYRLPEENDCVLCGLCVRACREIVGVSAISVIQRGIARRIAAPFQVTSSRCIGCGTCVLICPTGAFQFSKISGTRHDAQPEPAYRRRYYRVGAELDLRPSFVQDVGALLAADQIPSKNPQHPFNPRMNKE